MKPFSQNFLNQNLIAVNATALKSGGALSILRQFLEGIKDNNTYFVFVNKELEWKDKGLTKINLIPIDTSSSVKRIIWDWFGLKQWLKKHNLFPAATVSLQNTSIATVKGSVLFIYLHQALLFHHQSWSFFKKNERSFAFYKYIYPLFVFIFTNRSTKYIVQTQWMKNALCKKYKKNKESIYVIKPAILACDIGTVKLLNLPYKQTIFYPATGAVFKNHKEIICALGALKKRNVDLSSVGLYLTINANEDKEISKLINQFDLNANVQFLGDLSYDNVLVYYKSCTTVVFPSYIESFGLPLLEAAAFGKPLIALDTDYAREVIENYKGVIFAKQNSPDDWGRAIMKSFSITRKFKPYKPDYETSWDDFFKLINELI
jgi:glycosyltransferase involved in cell wall biosynthesis